MPRKKKKTIDDNFIMSHKYDFVFKYIFGNEKHKDQLIALLNDILASIFYWSKMYTSQIKPGGDTYDKLKK